MPRELLRLPYPTAELILLQYPDRYYQVDIYWRTLGYYEQLIRTDRFDLAQSAILKVAQRLFL